jgi:hypothetical protein
MSQYARMTWVGVDPGKSGAIAVIRADDGNVSITTMPVIVSGKARPQYDLHQIAMLLEPLVRPFVTVERAQPLPPKMGGSIANFERGVSRGWEWMLTALEIPFQMVSPRTWQAVMLIGTAEGDTKQRAAIAAQRLFPGVNLRRTERSRKVDDGFCDALLLAEYGRRTCTPAVSAERRAAR